MSVPSRALVVKLSAVSHTIGIFHLVAAIVRADASNSRIPQVRAKAEADEANGMLAIITQVKEIKDALMQRLKNGECFRYSPTERMTIPELKTAHAWSIAHTARQFIVAHSTVIR